MKKTDKLKTPRQLVLKGRKARLRAHAPYSGFFVGCALETKSNQVFTGCNVENASYGATICAERVAFLKAVSEGHKKFRQIVIVGKSTKPVPPCAQCLQMMAEFCEPDFVIHLVSPTKHLKTYKLEDLLPHPFNSSFF